MLSNNDNDSNNNSNSNNNIHMLSATAYTAHRVTCAYFMQMLIPPNHTSQNMRRKPKRSPSRTDDPHTPSCDIVEAYHA